MPQVPVPMTGISVISRCNRQINQNLDNHYEYEETDCVSTVGISTYGVAGLAGFIVLLIIDIFLYLYDRYISKEKLFTIVL